MDRGIRFSTLLAYCRNCSVARERNMSPITADGGVVELTREEGRRMLDERTRRELGLSLEEFERAYDAGTLDTDRSDVIGLVMLLPFARLRACIPWRTSSRSSSFLCLWAATVTCEDQAVSPVLLDGNVNAR
jgi:hypothetical protein